MANPRLEISIGAEIRELRTALQQAQAELRAVGQAGDSAGSAASRGLRRVSEEAKAQARAAREAEQAQVRAARQAAQEQVRAAREVERARVRAANEAERAEARAAREAERAAQAQRRQATNRTAQVAPQLTDIGTQLAGGANPLLVAIQQGGQLRDIFGGVGPAIRGVGQSLAGLVTPLSAAAVAVGALAIGFIRGRDEGARFVGLLAETGNVSGVTADQLNTLADSLDSIAGVTQSSAASALAAVVSSGRFAAEQIELVARTAEQLRETAGREVQDTVAEFAKLAGDPVAAAEELNRRYGFLNGSILEQIRLLQDQGRTQEAATIAIRAYADAVNQRTPEVTENLGTIETAWKAIKNAAREAGDALLEIGRQQTAQERIASLVAERDALNRRLAGEGVEGFLDSTFRPAQVREGVQRRIAAITEALAQIQRGEDEANERAGRAAAQARAVRTQQELEQEAREVEDRATRRARRRAQIEERARKGLEDAEKAGDTAAAESIRRNRTQLLANLDREEAEEAQRRADEAKRRAEAAAQERTRTLRESANVAGVSAGLVRDSTQRALAELDRFYAEGRVKLDEYFRRKAELEREALNAALQAAQAELAAADTSDARARAESEILRIRRDLAEVGPRTTREQVQAERDLEQQLVRVRDRLREIQGTRDPSEQAAAAARGVESEFAALRERLVAEGDAEGISLVDALVSETALRTRLQATETAVREAVGRLREEQSGIADLQQLGGISEADAETQLQAARETSLQQLRDLRAELAAYYDTAEGRTPAVAAAIRSLDVEYARIQQSQDKFTQGLKDAAQQGLEQFFVDIATGAKSLKDAVLDLARNFVRAVAQMVAQELALRTVRSLFSAFGGGVSAPVNHSGGMVGTGPRRLVSPLVFAGAPRYHSGGMVGLKPGEVPSILQTGEEVLSRTDPRNAANGGRAGAGTGVRIVNVVDPSMAADFLESAAGERVVMNVLSRNAAGMRQILQS